MSQALQYWQQRQQRQVSILICLIHSSMLSLRNLLMYCALLYTTCFCFFLQGCAVFASALVSLVFKLKKIITYVSSKDHSSQASSLDQYKSDEVFAHATDETSFITSKHSPPFLYLGLFYGCWYFLCFPSNDSLKVCQTAVSFPFNVLACTHLIHIGYGISCKGSWILVESTLPSPYKTLTGHNRRWSLSI